MRVWEINTRTRSLNTWKRVEYATDRVDQIVLVEAGAVVDYAAVNVDRRTCTVA